MPGTLKTQDHVYLSISTPLGKDAFILMSLEGKEKISEDFEFTLTMYATSQKLDVKSILGKPTIIKLSFKDHTRYIHGIFKKITKGPTLGYSHKNTHTSQEKHTGEVIYYQAIICSQFGLLQYTQDCHIFQNESVMDITKKLLKEHSVSHLKDKTQSSGHEKREYCVQYNESIFNFCSRLWESEGIFYFFEHAENHHTLVLADKNNAYETLSSGETVSYAYSQNTHPPFLAVFGGKTIQNTVPKSYASTDFNELKPKTSLATSTPGTGDGGEIFEYPGDYETHGQGESLTKKRLEAWEAPHILFQGSSTVPFFMPGNKFHLKGHEHADVNIPYVLLSVTHTARYDTETQQFIYENTFEAMPLKTVFKPPLKTPRPRIYGSQTAIVTGKTGEEIWTDKYSRIKVKFHWDRKGKNDETSSCWIRVASLWAGSHWGILFTPRVGQEVVISYLNGDPDHPLVTGMVYNGDHLPPYRPSDPTKSTLKSNTSKGGGGFNEIRFEDKKDHEEIYVHAQKDMKIDILHDRVTTLQKGNCTTTLKQGNRTVTLEKGNETHKVKGNYTREIEKDYTLKIKGNLTIEVGGDIQIKSRKNTSILSNTNITFKSGQNFTLNSGTNLTLKSGANWQAEAGATMLLKATATAEYIANATLTIKGAVVKIN